MGKSSIVILAILSSGCCVDYLEGARENEARRLAALDAALAPLGLTRVELELVCGVAGTSLPGGVIEAAGSFLGYCMGSVELVSPSVRPSFAKDSQGRIVALKEIPNAIKTDEQDTCGCSHVKGIKVETLVIGGKLPAGASTGATVDVSYSYEYTRLKSDCSNVP
ncbi:MAG: hypothetical protein ACOY3Y_02545 [Acidobacteriota bacterium]